MKTTWQEIKERVELKIGETIDMKEFTVLANEAISDLQEVAMVKAPLKHYEANEIMTEDEEYEFRISDIIMNSVMLSQTKVTYEFGVELPFEYNPGYGELKLISLDANAPLLRFSDDDQNKKSAFINIVETNDPNGLKRIYEEATVPNSTKNFRYKIVRKTMSILGKDSCMNEVVIKKPSDLLIPIDLQILSGAGIIHDAEFTTSSNPFDNHYKSNTNTMSAYYVENDFIHVFTEVERIGKITFKYFKTMSKVKPNITPELQDVELEPGFENLMTLAICHKWLENFVGTEDQETQTMFKKYLTLKQEYEATAKARKTERRQTRIIEAW